MIYISKQFTRDVNKATWFKGGKVKASGCKAKDLGSKAKAKNFGLKGKPMAEA